MNNILNNIVKYMILKKEKQLFTDILNLIVYQQYHKVDDEIIIIKLKENLAQGLDNRAKLLEDIEENIDIYMKNF